MVKNSNYEQQDKEGKKGYVKVLDLDIIDHYTETISLYNRKKDKFHQSKLYIFFCNVGFAAATWEMITLLNCSNLNRFLPIKRLNDRETVREGRCVAALYVTGLQWRHFCLSRVSESRSFQRHASLFLSSLSQKSLSLFPPSHHPFNYFFFPLQSCRQLPRLLFRFKHVRSHSLFFSFFPSFQAHASLFTITLSSCFFFYSLHSSLSCHFSLSSHSLGTSFARLYTFISRISLSLFFFNIALLPSLVSSSRLTFLLSLACRKRVGQAPSKNSYPESR